METYNAEHEILYLIVFLYKANPLIIRTEYREIKTAF